MDAQDSHIEANAKYKLTLGLTAAFNLTASVVIDSKPAPIPALSSQHLRQRVSLKQ